MDNQIEKKYLGMNMDDFITRYRELVDKYEAFCKQSYCDDLAEDMEDLQSELALYRAAWIGEDEYREARIGEDNQDRRD